MTSKPWRATLVAGYLAALLTSPHALAQKAAEQFIPLGQSPGLSGQVTRMGVIRHVDPSRSQVSLELDGGGTGTVTVAPGTRVWVDRSLSRQPNMPGGFADLKPGLRMEAMPQGPDGVQAEWVKVEPATP